jgi:hypothetical protein
VLDRHLPPDEEEVLTEDTTGALDDPLAEVVFSEPTLLKRDRRERRDLVRVSNSEHTYPVQVRVNRSLGGRSVSRLQ